MAPPRPCWSWLVLLTLGVATSAAADDRFLLLFGGPDHQDFLGCLSCSRSEAFSVWNADSRYGSTTQPDSIWNRDGRYGSPKSPFSPWNPRASTPPIVVDRAGNLYGKFTRNTTLPGRIEQPGAAGRARSAIERDNLDLLNWILDNYDGLIENLDEARLEF